MFLLFNQENFNKLVYFKNKLTKLNKNILFYDLLDLLAYLSSGDKLFLNNIYGLKIKRRNYGYLLRRYNINYKNIDNIDIDQFIKIRFRNLLKLIDINQIKQLAQKGIRKGNNIIYGGDDFIFFQRRFISSRLSAINFLYFIIYSSEIYAGKDDNQEILERIYKYEREKNNNKIYLGNNVIRKYGKKYKVKNKYKLNQYKIKFLNINK